MKITPLITLWKVIKLSLFIGIALLLLQYPGHVSVSWLDYDIEMALGVLVAGLFVLVSVLLWTENLGRRLIQMPRNIFRRFRRNRRQKGLEALLEAVTCISSLEPKQAYEKALKAQRLNPEHPLNEVLAAQAAYLQGDQKTATAHFHALTRSKATSFLGSRGLFLQAKQSQNWEQAREHLKRAYEIRPHSPWLLRQMVDLELQLGFYEEAKPFVDQLVSKKALTKTEGSRLQAIISWLKAQEAFKKGNEEDYAKFLNKSHDQAPQLTTVAIELARFLHKTSKDSRATKVLHRSYEAQPHPSLEDALRFVLHDLTALDYYKEVEKLIKSHPDHRDSHYVIAKAALKACLWGQARHHLELLSTFEDSQRVCRLMAELEELENPDRPDLARAWWRKALEARQDAGWSCTSCQAPYSEWHAFCSQCGSIDHMEWKDLATVSINHVRLSSSSLQLEVLG